MRYLWIFILAVLSISAVSGQNISEVGLDSDKVDSVKIIGDQTNKTEIRLLNKQEYPNGDELNVGIYFGIELNISEDQTAKIKINEDRVFAEYVISENPSYFGGPGHTYSPGLYGMIKKDNLEYKSLYYSNGVFTRNITEPGTYYVIFEGTNSSRKAYRGSNGNCIIAFEKPGPEYTNVDNCIEETERGIDYILISIIAVVFVAGLIVIYKSYFIAKRKLLLLKINRKTEELENSKEVRKDELEDLYKAMDYALNGNYKEASRILDQID